VLKNVMSALMLVGFLSACGATAAEVTVSGAPTTTSPPAAADNSSDDQDDLDSIRKMGQFVDAADNVDWTGVRSLVIPGITLLEADQPSVGPETISLALMGNGDYGMAILSPSGTCLWYAFLGNEDRFGTGQACTAVAAVGGSTTTLPADSPWHVVVDQAAPLQAKAAQSTLRNALVAAKVFYSDAGTFNGVTVAKLQEIEPNIVFVGAGEPSTTADNVSIAFSGDQFGAAATSANGTCYWIAESLGSATRYGEGTPCTGAAALAATGTKWKADG
jgi:hypothetical protein